ncbi:histidine phosphatase family protein [Nocardioides sp. NPDC058538]|uniref:histidine phosphatase family protein n=1 Tax=Nocardioides sp. NPDC058538 TaxID=3346542 RepID=UPI0036672F54
MKIAFARAATLIAACGLSLSLMAGCSSATEDRPTETKDSAGRGAGTTIYFVRHGSSLFNEKGVVMGWSDSPLTPHGTAQVELAATALSDVDFDAALTSDSGRTRRTADLILDSDVTPIATSDLREESYGGFEGGTDEELWVPVLKELRLPFDLSKTTDGDIWTNPDLLDAYYNTPHDEIMDAIADADPRGMAEGSTGFNTRIAASIDKISELAEANPGGSILVVSHGGTLAELLEKVDPAGFDYKNVALGNASITTATFDDGNYNITAVNESPQEHRKG